MRKKILVVIIVLLVWPVWQSSSDYTAELSVEEIEFIEKRIAETTHRLDSIDLVRHNNLMDEIQKKLNVLEIHQFMQKLAIRESSGDWKVVNRFGYVGKYQFGVAARKSVGAPVFTVKQFIKNPDIWPEKQQDTAALKLMRLNYRYLTKFFSEPGDELHIYLNRTFTLRDRSKVTITTAGLLAASHLVGPKSVRSFLNTRGRIDIKDGNGTKCSDYMKHFDDYTFVLNE